MDIDRVYQGIGEFTVCFQWLESQFREIGWLLLDPHRTEWPPKKLRNLTNHDLLERVQKLYTDRISTFPGVGALDYCDSFRHLVTLAHEARRTRNALLHSAFIELKAGGEVHGVMRVNPRLVLDEDGEHQIESELLTETALVSRIMSLAPLSVAIGMHHTQLIHWLSFDPAPTLIGCGLMFHQTGLPFAADTAPPRRSSST